MPETITPAVPPTPPVPLSALLAREDLALRQIAGPSDPDIVIHWAHTSEMADPYPYLLGGELLLTAGVHIPEAAGSGTYFDDYVSRIVAAGGAALGFGLAPVHDTVPRALVAACDAYGLPLLEVPPQTTFSGVARAVWQLMAQARLAELRRVTEAQQSLAAAASRPDPVPSVLRQLAQRLAGHAILYGPDGTEIATAGREPAEGVREALAGLAGVVRPTGRAAQAPAREPHEPPGAAPSGSGSGGTVGLAGRGTGGSAGGRARAAAEAGAPLGSRRSSGDATTANTARSAGHNTGTAAGRPASGAAEAGAPIGSRPPADQQPVDRPASSPSPPPPGPHPPPPPRPRSPPAPPPGSGPAAHHHPDHHRHPTRPHLRHRHPRRHPPRRLRPRGRRRVRPRCGHPAPRAGRPHHRLRRLRAALPAHR
ncbi:PucR family transcriptional regulator ligand-binding domain-containing protein [Streptomyces diastatochromogenes]|uniref:PucR family transcriptional regulator ligand-binding domain-containing protein n=1 Tax=Streptomyces diastatochromogenes TaxID=42236 RepID=UPI0036481F3A